MSNLQQQPPALSSPSRSAGAIGPAHKKKRVAASGAGLTCCIGVVGSGNMARAIVEGALASGMVPASNVTASATSESSENYKKMKALGVNMTTDNQDIVRNCDVIIVSVKPYQVLAIMADIQATYGETQTVSGAGMSAAISSTPKNLRPLIVSVAAAITLSDMEQKTEISWNMGGSPISGHLPVIRCLPNIGCSVRAGVTTYTRGKFCNETDAKPFVSIFSLISHCEEVEEKYLNAFGAFGSAVAYMAVAVESMADGGVVVGLPRPMAQRIAAYTMLSTAKLLLEGKQHPGELKDAVCSPGGMTIHGIQSLERSGFRSALIDALKASNDRAEELRRKP